MVAGDIIQPRVGSSADLKAECAWGEGISLPEQSLSTSGPRAHKVGKKGRRNPSFQQLLPNLALGKSQFLHWRLEGKGREGEADWLSSQLHCHPKAVVMHVPQGPCHTHLCLLDTGLATVDTELDLFLSPL